MPPASTPERPALRARMTRAQGVVQGNRPPALTARGGFALAGEWDEITRHEGPRVYQLMKCDPAIAGSLGLLLTAALAEPIRIMPAVTEHDAPMTGVSRRRRDADIRAAARIADMNRRGLDRLERPINETLEDWADAALTYGNNPCEQTYEEIKDADGKKRILLQTLRVLERTPDGRPTWTYYVDAQGRAESIEVPTLQDRRRVPREKFGVLSWKPRGLDPRGRSILRPAFNPWNAKIQAFPEFLEYLAHFGTPSLAVTAGQDAEATTILDPETGAEIGLEQPEQRLARLGADFRNATFLALPYGSTPTLLESRGEGGPFHNGFAYFNAEIQAALLLGVVPPRPDMDPLESAIAAVQKAVERTVQDDILYWQTRLNEGKDVADRLTPRVSLGRLDRATLEWMKMMAVAFQCQMLTAADRPAIRERLGLPHIPGGQEGIVLNADGRPMGGPAAEPGPGTLGLPLPPFEELDEELDEDEDESS